MRACVLGANGQLGRALVAALPGAVTRTRDELDVGDPGAVDALDLSGVDVVFNAAAHTAVDRAETEPAAAWRANALGPAHLAAATARHGVTLVHVSTEYVLDGTAPGAAGEDAPLAPLGVYGASKAAGELAVRAAGGRHVIARTSWLVGDGPNFVATMARLARDGACPSVVDDQVGRLTFAPDLAAALVTLAAAGHGVYHVTGDGEPVSWHGVAAAVFARCGRDPGDVRAVSTAEYSAARGADTPQLARRPANSVLDLGRARAAGVSMPAWPGALDRHLAVAR